MKTIKIHSERPCFLNYGQQDIGCQECAQRDECKVESKKTKIYVVRRWYDVYTVI